MVGLEEAVAVATEAEGKAVEQVGLFGAECKRHFEVVVDGQSHLCLNLWTEKHSTVLVVGRPVTEGKTWGQMMGLEAEVKALSLARGLRAVE